jgi:hypothetical protein
MKMRACSEEVVDVQIPLWRPYAEDMVTFPKGWKGRWEVHSFLKKVRGNAVVSQLALNSSTAVDVYMK